MTTIFSAYSACGVAIGGDGVIYVTVYFNNTCISSVRSITHSGMHLLTYLLRCLTYVLLLLGVEAVLAGSSYALGKGMYVDEPGYNDGVGTSAHFSSPHGVAVSPSGFVFIADSANNAVREINPSRKYLICFMRILNDVLSI